MNEYIQITLHQGGRYRYSIAVVDDTGEPRHQQHFFSQTDTIHTVDFLLRMGYQLAGASEPTYLRLMQHDDMQ